jgi:hypothetical protein
VFVDFPGTVIRFRLSQLFGLSLFPGSEYEDEILCNSISSVAYGFVDLSAEVETQRALSYLTSSAGVLSFCPSGMGPTCSP